MKFRKAILILCLCSMLAASPLLLIRSHAATCPVCGEDMSSETLRAATCTESGLVYYWCPGCKYVPYPNGQITPALGHSLDTETTKEPTCTEAGTARKICKRCKAQETVPVPALGHKWDTDTVSPTCTKAGKETKTCERCGKQNTKTLAALGHAWVTEIIEPTCTEEGSETRTCKRCGNEETAPIDALGHDMTITVIYPSCTHEGHHYETCERCGERTDEVLPANGHSYEVTETAAGCLEKGEKVQVCSVCGDTVTESIPAKGHHFGPWAMVLEPKLFQEGLEERACEDCGEKESRPLPRLTEGKGGIIAAIAGAIALVGGGGGILLSKSVKAARIAKAAKAAETATEGLGMITLKTQTLLLCLKDTEENREFEKQLLNRPYLKVLKLPSGGEDELPGKAKEERPDLILLSCEDTARLNSLMAKTKELYDDALFAAVDETGTNSVALEAMKESGKLFAAAPGTDKAERKLAKLVLPLYKPDKATDNYAENATLITDALGLPVISLLLNLYVVGGDVVGAVKARGMGAADTADLVNDVAGLLGLDVLGDVAEALRIGADQTERIKDRKETKEVK